MGCILSVAMPNKPKWCVESMSPATIRYMSVMELTDPPLSLGNRRTACPTVGSQPKTHEDKAEGGGRNHDSARLGTHGSPGNQIRSMMKAQVAVLVLWNYPTVTLTTRFARRCVLKPSHWIIC